MEGGLRLQTRRALLQHMIPQYRKASTVKKKSKQLDAFTATTGHHRKYAMWLLNHAQEGQHPPELQRPRYYGPDVQHALFLVWHAANRICAKRLIPYLPTLVEALERHEHLHLTEECRSQLLSMSAATADGLLRSQCKGGQRGFSTTRAGTLLKQQIPIRTFEDWKETHPGFLEADLVAHCGADSEGRYLYTLTLTDVATGWTECFPLLHRREVPVLAALQRVRTLFPFPILGIDTDNGGEFINDTVIAYCEQEQITFTRGRPHLKNDQCNALSEKWRDGAQGWSGDGAMTASLENALTDNSPNSTGRYDCMLTAFNSSEMREKRHGTQPFFVLSQFGECLAQHLNQIHQGWKNAMV